MSTRGFAFDILKKKKLPAFSTLTVVWSGYLQDLVEVLQADLLPEDELKLVHGLVQVLAQLDVGRLQLVNLRDLRRHLATPSSNHVEISIVIRHQTSDIRHQTSDIRL